MAQMSMVYEDLFRALKVLRLIDDKTSKSRIFYAMWLLEKRKLKPGINIHVRLLFNPLAIGTVDLMFLVFCS